MSRTVSLLCCRWLNIRSIALLAKIVGQTTAHKIIPLFVHFRGNPLVPLAAFDFVFSSSDSLEYTHSMFSWYTTQVWCCPNLGEENEVTRLPRTGPAGRLDDWTPLGEYDEYKVSLQRNVRNLWFSAFKR